MKMTVRFEGGKELAAALNSLPPRVRGSKAREVLRDAAEPMRALMGKLAPREPGPPDMADSMTISNVRKVDGARTDDKSQAVAVGPSKDAYYAKFQEFGTVHHSAQPFARPAFDSEAGKALKEIGRRLWVELAARGIGRSVTGSGPISGGEGGSVL